MEILRIKVKQELLMVYILSFDKPQTIVVYITGIRKNRQTDGRNLYQDSG